MANEYTQGNVVRFSASFTDPYNGDAAVDPTTVKFTIKDPTGHSVTYIYGTHAEVVKDSAGNYHADIAIPLSGYYEYYWHSEGEFQAADDGTVLSTKAKAL